MTDEELLQRITTNPKVMVGKPCIRGLRYPVEVILELELLGDRHPVIAHERRTPLLLHQNGLGARTQGDAHSIGELRRAAQDLVARGRPKQNLFM